MEWTTGDNDGGINGIGGKPAIVGFDSGGKEGSYFFGGSGTSSVIAVDMIGNFNIRGLWIFRTDGEKVKSPSMLSR